MSLGSFLVSNGCSKLCVGVFLLSLHFENSFHSSYVFDERRGTVPFSFMGNPIQLSWLIEGGD